MSEKKMEFKNSKFQVSRRGFVKTAGVAGIAAGAARWMPRAWAQSATSRASILPRFPLDSGVGSADDIKPLLAYDPNKDPNAKYYRSRIPRAKRIPAFAATQAHPKLSPEPQVTVYDDWSPTRYGNKDEIFISRFYHSVDIFDWGRGTVIVPDPALADSAHRNGALALSNVVNPYFAKADPTSNDDFLQTDEASLSQKDVTKKKYLVGNKMVELAHYFGYDGYVISRKVNLYQRTR